MDTTQPKVRTWTENLKFLGVAAGGLFGDGYLNQTIGLVIPMIGYLYFKDSGSKVSTIQGSEIKGSFAIGMIVGQLAFGTLGDALGRHRVYGKECLFAIFGTLMVVLLPWHGLSHQGVVAWLSVLRVVSGVGAGGDYPMTSSISAEHNPMGSRAKLILFVFTSLPSGTLAAGIIYTILLSAFRTSIENNIDRVEWVWRLLLGLGIVPLTITLYARLRMKETKPYEKYVAMETSLSHDGRRGFHAQLQDFREYFSQWRHARVLIATSLSWFLFDIANYGISLNQSIVLADIGYGSGGTKFQSLYNTAIGNIIVSFAGQLPGAWLAIFLPDLIGRRNQQFFFSLASALFYAVWAGVAKKASSGGLIALFTLSSFAMNAGPAATTFLLPVEVFPTRVRGSAHGISAAAGKCGVIVTAYAFGGITDSLGLSGALGLFAGVMVLTAACALVIPEPKGKTLEEIEFGVLYGETLEYEVPSERSLEDANLPSKNVSTNIRSEVQE